MLALDAGFAFFDLATGAIERLCRNGTFPKTGSTMVNAIDAAASEPITMIEHSPGGAAVVHRLDADLFCHHVEGGISISNSLAWSPSNCALYYADMREGPSVPMISISLRDRSPTPECSQPLGNPAFRTDRRSMPRNS